MEIAEIYVKGVTATAFNVKKIPKGIIGATIRVTFADDWHDMQQMAVFQGVVTKDVVVTGSSITIPAECVEEAGYQLRVGFYGVADEMLAIPTIWADLGMIQDAADPSGDESTDPTLPVWAQLQDQIERVGAVEAQIEQNKTDIEKLNDNKLDASALPTAINTALAQAKETGEFDGAVGPQGQKGDKGDTGSQGIQGVKGDKGDTGAAGKDGTSVTVKSVSESTADGGSNVVTFSDGKTVTIKNGSKGSAGATGPKGDKGETGATGPAGPAGPAGATGSQGPKGDKGDPGRSIGIFVTDHGAKGDGSTDDTAAFQAALSENRVVYVPGGTYKLSDTLVIRENCCLELSQDTVLQFTNTSGNCIEMRGSATLRGNHAMISAPYAFTGNVISMDTSQEGESHNNIPPYLHSGSHMFKRQRFIYDINILKPDSNGICKSTDGKCNGTAIYMHCLGTASIRWMWGITMSGVRIAGGFSYGIRAYNIDKSGDYEDNAWNHDMRIEAIIENCEIGVSMENCNCAHLAVTVQPHATESGVKYAKHGIYLNDAMYIDMIGSRVWDWNANNSLWTSGGQYQHIAMIGNCKGLLLDDFLCHAHSEDIRDLIYTDTPSNFDTMSVLQEPGSKWFKSVDGTPYFNDGKMDKQLAMKSDIDEYFQTDRVQNYTDVKSPHRDGIWDNNGTLTAVTSSIYIEPRAFSPGDVVRIRGINFASSYPGKPRMYFYNKSNGSYKGAYNFAANTMIPASPTGSVSNNEATYEWDAESSTMTIRFNGSNVTSMTAAYLYGFGGEYAIGYKADSVIMTVNEEITFSQAGFLADGIKVKSENVIGGGGGGADGFSPVVNVTAISNGHRVTITDAEGTETFDVLNGAKGDTGATGAAGADYVLTDADKAEIAQQAAALVPGGGGGAATPDWNANDGEAGYIANRTHYEEDTKDFLFDGTFTKRNMSSVVSVEFAGHLIPGQKYAVVYKDVSYEATAYLDGDGWPSIGGFYDADTGEFDFSEFPFCLFGEFDDDSMTYELEEHSPEKGTFTLSVAKIVKSVKCLDEKFIPDTIARKSDIPTGGGGGTGSEIVELMPDTQFVYVDSMGLFMAQTDFQFVAGKTYVIKYNGVEYTVTAKFGAYSMDGTNAAVIFVGNSAVFGGENNGLPFALAVVPFMSYFKGMLMGAPLDGATSITASVKGAASSALYKDPYAPLVLDGRIDSSSGELTVIYGDDTEVCEAFLTGREIVVIAYKGVAARRYTVVGCSLVTFLYGDASQIPTLLALTSYTKSLTDVLEFEYNGDGTFVPYSG